jgi:hypothetical protein
MERDSLAAIAVTKPPFQIRGQKRFHFHLDYQLMICPAATA